MSDRIDDIRERHVSCDYIAIDRQALADIAYLLGEVERLKTAAREDEAWEWSAGDVVLDPDGIAWQRDDKRIHYPWHAVGQPVQRDRDITDLVAKHGARVLVCKARGIGGASC